VVAKRIASRGEDASRMQQLEKEINSLLDKVANVESTLKSGLVERWDKNNQIFFIVKLRNKDIGIILKVSITGWDIGAHIKKG